MITIYDKFLIGFAFAVAICLSLYFYIYLPSTNLLGNTVVVSMNRNIYNRYDLNKNQEYTIYSNDGKNFNTFKIFNNTVKMIDASCNDKICTQTHNISKNYESIICLPNRVVVDIETAKDTSSNIDSISQ